MRHWARPDVNTLTPAPGDWLGGPSPRFHEVVVARGCKRGRLAPLEV